MARGGLLEAHDQKFLACRVGERPVREVDRMEPAVGPDREVPLTTTESSPYRVLHAFPELQLQALAASR